MAAPLPQLHPEGGFSWRRRRQGSDWPIIGWHFGGSHVADVCHCSAALPYSPGSRFACSALIRAAMARWRGCLSVWRGHGWGPMLSTGMPSSALILLYGTGGFDEYREQPPAVWRQVGEGLAQRGVALASQPGSAAGSLILSSWSTCRNQTFWPMSSASGLPGRYRRQMDRMSGAYRSTGRSPGCWSPVRARVGRQLPDGSSRIGLLRAWGAVLPDAAVHRWCFAQAADSRW
jgi:hypothetical protein